MGEGFGALPFTEGYVNAVLGHLDVSVKGTGLGTINLVEPRDEGDGWYVTYYWEGR